MCVFEAAGGVGRMWHFRPQRSGELFSTKLPLRKPQFEVGRLGKVDIPNLIIFPTILNLPTTRRACGSWGRSTLRGKAKRDAYRGVQSLLSIGEQKLKGQRSA